MPLLSLYLGAAAWTLFVLPAFRFLSALPGVAYLSPYLSHFALAAAIAGMISGRLSLKAIEAGEVRSGLRGKVRLGMILCSAYAVLWLILMLGIGYLAYIF